MATKPATKKPAAKAPAKRPAPKNFRQPKEVEPEAPAAAPDEDTTTFTFYADNGAQRSVDATKIVSVSVGKPIPDPANPEIEMLPAVVQVRRSNGALVAITSNESVASINARLDAIGITEITSERLPDTAPKAAPAAKPAAKEKAEKAPKEKKDTAAVKAQLVEFIRKSFTEDPTVKAYKVERAARGTGLRFGPTVFAEAVTESGIEFAKGRTPGERGGAKVTATPEQLDELVRAHMKANPSDDMFDLQSAARAAGYRPDWNPLRAATKRLGMEVPTRKPGRIGGVIPKGMLEAALSKAFARGAELGKDATDEQVKAEVDAILAGLDQL